MSERRVQRPPGGLLGTARGDPLVGTLVDARPAAVEAKVEREARVRMPLVLFDSDPLPEHLNCPWCRGELIVELFADSDLPGGELHVEDLPGAGPTSCMLRKLRRCAHAT